MSLCYFLLLSLLADISYCFNVYKVEFLCYYPASIAVMSALLPAREIWRV